MTIVDFILQLKSKIINMNIKNILVAMGTEKLNIAVEEDIDNSIYFPYLDVTNCNFRKLVKNYNIVIWCFNFHVLWGFF